MDGLEPSFAILKVTILDPMKRGLKAAKHLSDPLCDCVTILDPMKRGLKDPDAE